MELGEPEFGPWSPRADEGVTGRPAWNPRTIVVGANDSEATLHLKPVLRPPEGWWGIIDSPLASGALSGTLAETRMDILEPVIDEVDLSGVEHKTVEDIGDSTLALIGYAKSVGNDFLIARKRGAGATKRMMLGSVVNRVVHNPPCPILAAL